MKLVESISVNCHFSFDHYPGYPGTMLTMPRRPEFMLDSRETMLDVLDRARYGHLAFLDECGLPDLRPLNYARVDDTLYFHTAEGSTVARYASAGPVRLCAQDTVTWIPSYWRHPEMACPATTYYRSEGVRIGHLLEGSSASSRKK